MSLTEVYDRMVTNEDLLSAERVKTANLTAALERVALDIEKKGPMILRQKREHAESMEAIKQMAVRWGLSSREDRATRLCLV